MFMAKITEGQWLALRSWRILGFINCARTHTHHTHTHRVELGYNDISLCDTSFIASDTLWYKLIDRNIVLLGYNYTRL